MKIIEKMSPNDPVECSRELLVKWKKDKNPTWRQVEKCLREAKCGQLADNILCHISSGTEETGEADYCLEPNAILC